MKQAAQIAGLFLACSMCMFAADKGSAGDRVQIGHSIEVGPDETVGDAVCVGCSIHVAGHVMGDAVAVGGSLSVDGKVNGDTAAVGGSIHLGSEASVGGDAVGIGGGVEREPGSTVGGEVTSGAHFPMAGGIMGIFFLGLLGSIPFALVLSVICYLILGQQRVEVMVGSLRTRTGMAMLAGLAVLAGAAILMAVFPHTGTLKPIVMIAIAIAVCVSMIVGYTAVSMWAGRGVARGASPLGALIIGAIIVAVVQAIPIVGIFAFLVFALAAVGTAIVTGFGTHSDWLAQRSS